MNKAYIKAAGAGYPDENIEAVATPVARIEATGDSEGREMVGFSLINERQDDDGAMEVLVDAATLRSLVTLIRRSGKFPDLENALNAY